MVDNTWLEQYRRELHSLRDAGEVKAIRKKNMELNNRLEYVKDDGEREIFLTALYETEDMLRECRAQEKLRNGLAEYREEAPEERTEASSETNTKGESEENTESETDLQRAMRQEKERLPLRERFELECKQAEEGNAESYLWLAEFYESRGAGNKEQRNELLMMAAEKGNREARMRMARVYRDGDGLEKNPTKAHVYYDKLEREGDKEAAKEHCLLYYEEERYDRVYPYVKEMIENGHDFDPENNWIDACLLVAYTLKGIHYGELQSNLENLTEMRRMIRRVDAERGTKRSLRDKNVLYTMECLYMEALFRAGRHVGACHSLPEEDRYLYVYAILETALEAGGIVQKEVWNELLRICADKKEDVGMRDDLLRTIVNRLLNTTCYEEALYFADRALMLFKEDSERKHYKEKYYEIVKKMKETGRELFRCFESVVKRGGINTTKMLADCYYAGMGCEQSYEKAKMYYELGREGSFGRECRNGIRCCEEQFELKHALEVLKTDNFAQAVETIERLAKGERIAEAQYEYGRILEQGRYKKQDEYEAFVQYGYAAAQGHSEAKKRFAAMKRSHKDFWSWFDGDDTNYYKAGGSEGWNILKNL